MFFLSYTWSELRRRRGRTLLTAVGLGVGVALVVAVNALSAGLDDAQDEVLEPLTGVGADMTVTRPEGQPRERRSRVSPGELGEPGEKFTRTDFVEGPQLPFKAAKVAAIAALDGVQDAAGSLSVNALTVKGTVPERREQGAQVGPPPGGGGEGGQAPIDVTAMSVTGLDLAKPSLAPMTPSQISKGRYLEADDEVVVSEAYAKQHGLGVGDTLKLEHRSFEVVGLSQAPLGGSASDAYMELGRLQALSNRKGRVNQVQVRADDADSVAAVEKAIEATLEGASVTTASDLAERIGGSLVDARKLSSKLGTALTVVALVAAFLIASLLTLGGVAKRVRELGTLKAIGWPQRHVVRQVTGEATVQGLLGGLLGAGLGLAAAAAIGALGITLEASVPAPEQPQGGQAGGGVVMAFGQGRVAGGSTDIALGAPVDLTLLLLAVGLAVVGGLIAGSAGGLRAARLRPADALRSIG